MFRILYNLSITLYRMGIGIAALWNHKARQWISGRRNLFTHMASTLVVGEQRIWFHCASAGEFEQGRPVMEAFRQKFPAHKIVLTFFSPSGYELRKNYGGADYVFYLPADTAKNARKFLSLINPQLAVFVKYEFWFHFLDEIAKRDIPCIVVSAIFRKSHFIFNPLAAPLRKLLQSLDRIFVQDENSATLLLRHGFTNIEEAGDTRYDRVLQVAAHPKELPLVTRFCGSEKVLVAGSTWPPDEKLLTELAETTQGWKFILVPHEPDLKRANGFRNRGDVVLYSELEQGKSPDTESILWVDQMGLLSSLYRFATIAYVGGGFGAGIHNTLEAAVYGVPVLFGPAHQQFNEAQLLIESGGGKSISDFESLRRAFEFYAQPQNKEYGKKNRQLVEAHSGATSTVIRYLEKIQLR